MISRNTKFPHLLAPGKIGNLELKNRVVMGPTETLYATSDGEITDKIIDYYVERARGGLPYTLRREPLKLTRSTPIRALSGLTTTCMSR